MDRYQSSFGLFLFLFWLYHLLLCPTKLFLYVHGILAKQLWLWNQSARFSCFFLLNWWSIFFRTFVYNTNTLEVISDAIKFEMQVKYLKCVFIIIILFSNGHDEIKNSTVRKNHYTNIPKHIPIKVGRYALDHSTKNALEKFSKQYLKFTFKRISINLWKTLFINEEWR